MPAKLVLVRSGGCITCGHTPCETPAACAAAASPDPATPPLCDRCKLPVFKAGLCEACGSTPSVGLTQPSARITDLPRLLHQLLGRDTLVAELAPRLARWELRATDPTDPAAVGLEIAAAELRQVLGGKR